MIKFSYVFDPIALEEYKEAVAWYKQRSEIATEQFIACVQEKINLICSYPYRYRNAYRNFREISLKKFPFAIVYFVNEPSMEIVIVSVYHHKRNPKNKYKK